VATVFRTVGSIVAGMLVALILLVAVELFSAVVHPVPSDFGGNQEEMCAHVERYPGWVLAVVVPAWAGTALASTWIAGRLGNRGSALCMGLLLLAGASFNMAMLPYPMWFKAASLIAISMAIAGGVYGSGHRDATAACITN
jgi:hypothetical protein